MKKRMTLGMALVLTTALAGSALASSIAGKVWYADSGLLEESTLMYGATASLGLGEELWLSGMFLMGTYDDVAGTGEDWESADGELMLGYSFSILDIGIGARYSLWTFRSSDFEDEINIFGPMAYIGLGDSLGESPLGWYIGGSYMFKDLGDAYENDDYRDTFEHYNIEGGLSLFLEPVTATLGYRYKEYVNFDDIELNFSGVAASLGFGF